MRRNVPRLVTVLLILLAALTSVLLEPVNNWFNDWFKSSGLNTTTGRAGLILVVGFILVVAYLWDRGRAASEAHEAPLPSPHLRRILITKIFEFAQAQFDGGLYQRARKEFRLAERPLHLTARGSQPLDVTILEHYKGQSGPMLILGEPGTGKTTLLYELTIELLPREGNDMDPIPVPFELANWARQKLPLGEWIVAELNRKYGVGSSLAKRWVENGVILPMLDGLDEVPATSRDACVERIREYCRVNPGMRFVVTCREQEYRELNVGVDLGIHVQSAVVVGTLTRSDVATYLERNAESFGGLRAALGATPELWDLLTTPLMLWVGAFAFEGPAGSGDSVREGARHAALFDRYVDAMLRREGDKGREEGAGYPLAEARRWLCETAAGMSRAGLLSFHLEDISANWLSEAQHSAANLRVKLSIGLERAGIRAVHRAVR